MPGDTVLIFRRVSSQQIFKLISFTNEQCLSIFTSTSAGLSCIRE
jgi:hypothetical protein